ncbi:MAG: hypothetical protein ABR511_08230 [Acidimicrobiales bacterium]
MPRIEIELTSSQPDGTWTWRAAGARQPRGVLDGRLLEGGAAVGDVLRADCDVDLDGTRVTAVLPSRGKRSEPERLAILGSGREAPLVTQDGGAPDLRERPRRDGRSDRRPGRMGDGAGRPGGGPGGDRRPGARPDDGRGGTDRRPRADGGADRREAARGDRPAGGPRGGSRAGSDGPSGDRARSDRPSGDQARADRAGTDRPGADRPGGDRRAGARANRPAGARPGGRERPAGHPDHARRSRPEPAPAARPRAKRLSPGRTHRDAVLAELPPEQRPVAEQVLRGGIPSVRQAVQEQNAKARAAGDPEVKADALVGLAEALLPRLRAAEWRDRAEAAAADAGDIGLRDLRAVVAGSDAAGRDDESRALIVTLKDALERRSAEERDAWVAEVRASLTDGRVVRALRVSGRPPEPGVRFPTDLAVELGTAAGSAMTAETAPDRWAALLDAVVASPVRRTVQPHGVPAERGEDLERALRLAAPRVPALAALLGGVKPPAPRPPRPTGARPAPPPPAATAAPPASAPTPAVVPPATEPAMAAEPAPAGPAPAESAAADPPPAEGEPAPAQPAAASGDDGNDAVLVEELG